MAQAVSQSQSVGLRLTRLIVVDKKLGGVCPDAKVAKARAGSRVKKVVSARVGSLGNQDKLLLQLRTLLRCLGDREMLLLTMNGGPNPVLSRVHQVAKVKVRGGRKSPDFKL